MVFYSPYFSEANGELSILVPRLWPFLRHNAPSVRKATLQTLCSLLSRVQNRNQNWVIPILQDALRHIYQRALLEDKQDILHEIEEVCAQRNFVCLFPGSQPL